MAVRSLGAALVSVITGRRSRWLVLVLAVALVGVAGPLAGKLAPLENNSPTSFLPAKAPSTVVTTYLLAHSRESGSPAVVVFAAPRRLGAAALGTIVAARRALAARGLPGVGRPGPVVVSRDRRAAYFVVPVATHASAATSANDVEAVRRLLTRFATPATSARAGRALSVAVGGPAGAAADALNAFSGIDGKLLGVTVAVVALILLLVYRSPVLWLVPLVSVLFAAGWSQGVAYLLAKAGFVINGMTVGILTVLVFGAGTDYALLLLARYREELHRHERTSEAMAVALRRSAPAILASGLTVVLALICLLLARLNDIAALGPACAGGILCALAAQLVVLPALLLVLGRRVFWPFIPRPSAEYAAGGGLWERIAASIPGHRRAIWVVVTAVLAVGALGLIAYRGGVSQQNGFRGRVGSVAAQQILAANFAAGTAAPAEILVRPAAAAAAAAAAARATPGVKLVSTPVAVGGGASLVDATLAATPTSVAAQRTVVALRRRLLHAVGQRALVGGETATNVDLAAAASHDRELLLPVILAVVMVMLGVLLSSLVAPLLLVATVLLSYAGSLGVSALVFRYIFAFPGFDPTVPILGFVFLVALGVDYNVFLMARVKEEARAGAIAAVTRGLAVTGGVITSAGVVLAATFAVLGVLPLIALTEVGFLVAFGVLVDTVLVRSALVPALAIDVGARLWWPGELARGGDPKPE